MGDDRLAPRLLDGLDHRLRVLGEPDPVTIQHHLGLRLELLQQAVVVERLEVHTLYEIFEAVICGLGQTDRHFGHQCKIFDNTNFLTFRSFRWTNQSKMSIMKQSWLG